MSTRGQRIAEDVRLYLATNGLKQSQLTGAVLAAVADETLARLDCEAAALKLETVPENLKPKRRNPAGRNPLFDALAMSCDINPAEATSALRKTIGVALADIMSVSPNVAPEDFRLRAQAYRRKHKDWPLTPTALSKYWGEFGPANGMTFAAKQELAPAGWKEVYQALNIEWGNADRAGQYRVIYEWEQLGQSHRDAIKKRMAS